MNIKTIIFVMLCGLPLFVACNSTQQSGPGEKYETLTVTTTNQTL